jgi:plastocyanin
MAVVAGACGGVDDGNAIIAGNKPTTTSKAKPAANAVTMKLIAFKPDSLTVAAGSSVTWTQTDPGFHTVTSGTVEQGTGGVTEKPDGRFDSGQLATGKTFAFTFAEPGTYSYYCSVHPATMRGSVRVT